MNLLLDTHTLLWLMEGSPNLSGTAATMVADPSNRLYLSMASDWEMAIKIGLKKMTLSVPYSRDRPMAPKKKESAARKKKAPTAAFPDLDAHRHQDTLDPGGRTQTTSRWSSPWITGLLRSPPDRQRQREHLGEASFMGDQAMSQQIVIEVRMFGVAGRSRPYAVAGVVSRPPRRPAGFG